MKLVTEDLSVGEHQFQLILDDRAPVIKVGSLIYASFSKLLRDFPDLLNQKNIVTYCKFANFLFTGIMFTFIDDPYNYKKDYLKNLEKNKKGSHLLHPHIQERPYPIEEECFEGVCLDDPYSILAETGPFDVTSMSPPFVRYGQLVFFVEDVIGKLPFKVISPYPYVREDALVDYELLPPLEKNS